ncbi:MAG: hypothetical protein IPL28_05395 [Chloroflexi bacterium]|nr:hypothetical protein [Chloroflexota bacterium]
MHNMDRGGDATFLGEQVRVSRTGLVPEGFGGLGVAGGVGAGVGEVGEAEVDYTLTSIMGHKTHTPSNQLLCILFGQFRVLVIEG